MPLEVNPAAPPAIAGAGQIAAPPQPTPTQAGANSPAPVADPNAPAAITLTPEKYRQLLDAQTRVVEIEAEKERAAAEARTKEIQLMADKGRVEDAIKELREDHRKQVELEKSTRLQAEERGKRFAIDSALSKAVADHPLVPGGAEQLSRLFRGDMVAEAYQDSFRVTTPQNQPVADYIAAQLARPEFAHFLRASNPAGGTSGAPASAAFAAPTGPSNPAAPPVPKNFGEAIILQMAEIQKGKPSDSRLDPTVAMGLNARSVAARAK